MAKFPSETELKMIRKKMARAKGSRGLPADANALERAKYDVCEKILIYMKKKHLSQKALAHALEAPETRVSEIVHYRIEKFTLDRLIAYLQMIQPRVTVRVA